MNLGHFLTAKLFGVYCAEFSIGMGPKLSRKRRNNYQIHALLLVVMLQWQVKLIEDSGV